MRRALLLLALVGALGCPPAILPLVAQTASYLDDAALAVDVAESFVRAIVARRSDLAQSALIDQISGQLALCRQALMDAQRTLRESERAGEAPDPVTAMRAFRKAWTDLDKLITDLDRLQHSMAVGAPPIAPVPVTRPMVQPAALGLPEQ